MIAKYTIAVIDSGIEKTHRRFKNLESYGLTLEERSDEICCLENKYDDETGHGTAVTAIISKYTTNAAFYILKLRSTKGILTERLLESAIEHCLLRRDVRIINISLGVLTTSPSHKLYQLCYQAYKEGIVIVASAFRNPELGCYPCDFQWVFKVSSGVVKSKYLYGLKNSEDLHFLAMGTTQRVASLNDSFQISSGNSYATAHFTGIVASKMESQWINHSNLLDELSKCASNDVYDIKFCESDNVDKDDIDDERGNIIFNESTCIDFANEIALFPASEKEMISIIKFQDDPLFTKKVTVLIDYPKNLFFSSKFDLHPNLEIQRTSIGEAVLKRFDTLVLGYFLNQEFDANIIFGISILKQCIINDKNIILLDRRVKKLAEELILKFNPIYRGRLYHHRKDLNSFREVTKFKALPAVTAPVLAVIGTSNKQGKFTTQLRLRKLLNDVGYNVSLISTEPHGLLFGADYIFSYAGKNDDDLDLPQEKWSVFLNTIAKGIQYYKEPNIIITGTQGYTVHPQIVPSETPINVLYSLQFLMGVQADALVCAINPDDRVDTIKETIAAAEIISKAKVLFGVMTPFSRIFQEGVSGDIANYKLLNSEEYLERCKFFEQSLGLRIFDIMSKLRNDEDEILTIICKSFNA